MIDDAGETKSPSISRAPYQAPVLVRMDIADETQTGPGIGPDAFGQSGS
ncbi:MAG: hypothetical protein KGO96_05235 [Elusimicrobia bacterium]|nr:hypothetical protein [Elusimicrobiota bacterium]MDE2237507.1 hypothetical protein [Elusimicrobiota bacterium]MDE2425293.1 hypothetical protein [Elusimicrobiota bacterium]